MFKSAKTRFCQIKQLSDFIAHIAKAARHKKGQEYKCLFQIMEVDGFLPTNAILKTNTF